MMVTSDMDVLSSCDGFNNHHIGTLRCRQEGASTPSTKPVPTISGTSWIFGMNTLVLDHDDPLPNGYTIGDIWA